jgi:uncharacterized protein (DUF2267 family)
MSHPSFDHALQDANTWLKIIAETLHLGETRHAYSALRAVLHALRDRMTPERATHFSAQLPMLIRGLYFEGWRLAGKPTDVHNIDVFCDQVARELPPRFPLDALSTTRGVLAFLATRLEAGEIAKVIDQTPPSMRALWPDQAARA